MKLSADCIFCLITRQQQMIRDYKDEEKKTRYIKAIMRFIIDAGPGVTAPELVSGINRLHKEYFGFVQDLGALKKEYNDLLLQREAMLASRAENSGDALMEAVKLAIVGNYIDFGTSDRIDMGKLNHLLATSSSVEVDSAEYASFKQDLQNARHMAYLTDNCGEIVLDKILISTIRGVYPGLAVTAITRGHAVINDATEEDAEYVGLPAVAEVLGNGTDVAGTPLDMISGEARSRIMEADMIIAKGQGNFETLQGCGLNIYYLFLCKCDWFSRRFRLGFRLEKYKGAFVNERRMSFEGT